MLATLSSLLGFSSAAEGEKVRYPAPAVSGLNQDGVTPGCTKQACSLRDAFAELSKEGVQVLGVSFDKPEAQKKFRDDFKLPYDLIADPEGKIVDAFKVERMIKGLLNLASRQCFLIKDGKVIWQDKKASTSEQANDIKRVLAGLPKAQ